MSVTTQSGSGQPSTLYAQPQESTLPELLASHRRHLVKFRAHLEELGRPADAAVCATLITSSRLIERAIITTLQYEYVAAAEVRDLAFASLDRLSTTLLNLP